MAGLPLPEPTKVYPNDVKLYLGLLNSKELKLNAGDAGTAMRFACAVLSTIKGSRELHGSDRMHQRPIGILVDALRHLGAQIAYLGKEGFPPLAINGRQLEGGHLVVPSDVSSQYISALLMIAPTCKKPVHIELIGDMVSMPYIDMTISQMRQMGVDVQRKGRSFLIEPQAYKENDLPIECDWSAAAFMFEIAALAESCELELPGLLKESIQGDSEALSLFAKLGVETNEIPGGLLLKKQSGCKLPDRLSVDFTDIPDLLQAFAISCVALGLELKASGLYNLHLKETDRLQALKWNIEAMGGKVTLDGREAHFSAPQGLNGGKILKSFNDHRMAMSLAPLAFQMDELAIDDIEVVQKSFPIFWTEVAKLGLDLHENS